MKDLGRWWYLTVVALSLVSAIAAAAATAASRRGNALESTFTIAWVGGATQTGVQKCALDTFEAKYHVKGTYYAGPSPAQNLALIAAQRANPKIDIFAASLPDQYLGLHHGFFAPLPYSAIPNSKNIPAAIRKGYRNGGYDKSGIPFYTQPSAIAYNTKVFQENGWAPPTSWRDLWDPRFHGHVGLFPLVNVNPEALLVVASKLSGGNESHIVPGLKHLATMKASNLIYASTGLMTNSFQNGSLWIANTVGPRAYQNKQSGLPVEFVQPKEGVVVTTGALDLVKNAPHPNVSKLFINWMLRTDVQACMGTAIGQDPIIPAAAAQIPKDQRLYTVPQVKIWKIDWSTVFHNVPKWLKLAPYLT